MANNTTVYNLRNACRNKKTTLLLLQSKLVKKKISKQGNYRTHDPEVIRTMVFFLETIKTAADRETDGRPTDMKGIKYTFYLHRHQNKQIYRSQISINKLDWNQGSCKGKKRLSLSKPRYLRMQQNLKKLEKIKHRFWEIRWLFFLRNPMTLLRITGLLWKENDYSASLPNGMAHVRGDGASRLKTNGSGKIDFE